MPLTVENTKALLNEEFDMATQKTQRVKVQRAFYHKGKTVGVSSVLDFPIPNAIELRTANKVTFVQSDTKLKKTQDVPAPPDASLPEEGAGAKSGARKAA